VVVTVLLSIPATRPLASIMVVGAGRGHWRARRVSGVQVEAAAFVPVLIAAVGGSGGRRGRSRRSRLEVSSVAASGRVMKT